MKIPKQIVIQLINMSLALLSSYLQLLTTSQDLAAISDDQDPRFLSPIPNITVPVGRDVNLPCTISGLGSYKIAWLRVEDKGILTIHNHVITRNYRVSLHSEGNKTFVLVIKSVQQSDKGGYMCQINTVPMKSQIGYIDVVLPPKFESSDSSDYMVSEGSDVTLKCKARGHPRPTVKWRREDNNNILLYDSGGKFLLNDAVGENLRINRVTRAHMGIYLCIASNGVPPAISKRIMLLVNFAPSLWIPEKIRRTATGANVTIDCHVEAYPRPEILWRREKHAVIENSSKYQIHVVQEAFKVRSRMAVGDVHEADLGTYICSARNTLGSREETVDLIDSSENPDSQENDYEVGVQDEATNGNGPNTATKFYQIKFRDRKRNANFGRGQVLNGSVIAEKSVFLWLAAFLLVFNRVFARENQSDGVL